MSSPDSRKYASRRPSLLPAFEPLSSSPGGLPPRVTKRKFEDCNDDRQSYPTPIPTSSTGMLPSSPNQLPPLPRPMMQRAVSSLSERAPLGAVPSLDLHADGEPVLMGRSSNSSDYQLSANRLISRVHVRATYNAPTLDRLQGEVVVECLGWNGCKVHFRGKVADLAKGEIFVSDKPDAQIMVDVQDTRVMLVWPKASDAKTIDRQQLLSQSPRNENAYPIASSPPLMSPPLRSPISPTPGALLGATFDTTFDARQSFDLSDDEDGQVQVYEDHESPENLAREQTPTPVEEHSPSLASAVTPTKTPDDSQSSALSEPEELSEHDEENDPIVHSFGPFGEDILSKFESFQSTSPGQVLKSVTKSFACPQVKFEGATRRSFKESPIKNHVVNQLAYSRVHSVPLSTIYSNLPGAMKTAKDLSNLKSESQDCLTTEELKSLLDKIPCVGEIPREGKDAAGKVLENEFYYVPEMDDDEMRRTAVSIAKPPLRGVRKQHKVSHPRALSFDLSLTTLLL